MSIEDCAPGAPRAQMSMNATKKAGVVTCRHSACSQSGHCRASSLARVKIREAHNVVGVLRRRVVVHCSPEASWQVEVDRGPGAVGRFPASAKRHDTYWPSRFRDVLGSVQ